MKAFVINFNRLTLTVKMVNWLYSQGIEPVIIDNHSDYPPLLDYYESRCPFTTVMMDQNYGHMAPWSQKLIEKFDIKGGYIVTDPDLDLSGIPGDWLNVLEAGLKKYPQFDKCGFSLEINDLKNQGTIDWEEKFWQHPLDDNYFVAQIDTTFALYRTPVFSFNAIRTNRPYTARHLPWYYQFADDLPADEQYYYKTQHDHYREHTNVKWREVK